VHPSRSEVSVSTLHPDSLDLDIYREMYRNSSPNLAGIDPRLNTTRIAQRLKIGRARVAARVKAWNDSGFLLRYDVWLNPAIFGWRGAWLGVQVENYRNKPTVLSRLALVEGAVFGIEFLGEWVSLALLAPDSATLKRSVELIQGLAGVRAIEPPIVWELPRPKRQLTPLDIRIVHALREQPTATLSATAQRVGISTRTMTRRYSELIDSWAVWFVPVFDFRAISTPAVSVVITMAPGIAPEPVVRRVRTRFPLTIDFLAGDAGADAQTGRRFFLVMPPSAAHLEELERFVAAMAGVVSVETNVMVRMHSFPVWFDRQLETLGRGRTRGAARDPG
jgi:DNA-binding Lrp family transcriptional regulator